MDILKEMMASQAEREQYAQEMREKYPTAEQTLHEIKDRYEYENEEYKIIVPESLVDIVKKDVPCIIAPAALNDTLIGLRHERPISVS